jgi:hypothetical protein
MKLSEIEFEGFTAEEVREVCLSVGAQAVVMLEYGWKVFNK